MSTIPRSFCENHIDVILCCSLKPAPMLMFGNNAALDMLETMLVNLQCILLEVILDDEGRKARQVLQGHVTENRTREAGEACTQGSQHRRAGSAQHSKRFKGVSICTRINRQEHKLHRPGGHPRWPERPGLVPPVEAQQDGGGCQLIGSMDIGAR